MSRLEDRKKVHGFDNDVISVVKILKQQESDDEFKAVGIVGVRGVGKTTLCQALVSSPEVRKHNFVPRIVVCMSKNEDPDADRKVAVVKRMLTGLGVDEKIIQSITKDHDIAGLLYALYLQLIGKRYLIVLDDVEDDDDEWYQGLNSPISQREKWGDRLAYGFPRGYGGRVIVTSRSEKVAKKMVGEDIKNIYRLFPLSDPESCWSIFTDAGGKITEEVDQNFEELKKALLHKCVGLPLAAKMLGKFQQEVEAKKSQEGATHSSSNQR